MKYLISLTFLIISCTSEPIPTQPEPIGEYVVMAEGELFTWDFINGKLTEHRNGHDGCGQYYYVSDLFFITSPTIGTMRGILTKSDHVFTFETDSTTYTLIQ